jgi:hypothetical protein
MSPYPSTVSRMIGRKHMRKILHWNRLGPMGSGDELEAETNMTRKLCE